MHPSSQYRYRCTNSRQINSNKALKIFVVSDEDDENKNDNIKNNTPNIIYYIHKQLKILLSFNFSTLAYKLI